MTRYGTAGCGRKSRNYPLTGTKRNGLNGAGNRACSERVKIGPRQRSRPSGAKTVGNCGDKYVKYR